MKIDRDILIRYFSGDCSENEKTVIQQWLESDETHRQQFVRERIRFDATVIIDEDNIKTAPMVKRSLLRNFLKVASALLIMIAGSYLINMFKDKEQKMITQTIYVPTGNRISITLPDGSLVWLNSNTTLQYPNVFSGKERCVEVDGEAYFEVEKDKQKPFIVKIGQYNVEALGTSFNVEGYGDKPNFSTALFTGKVRVFREQDETENAVMLHPGETAELVDDELIVSPINTEVYKWRDGLIVIENKSFVEIMEQFEKYFGYEIIIQTHGVKDLGYRGKLRIADGVDHALRVLQNDYRFEYKLDVDTNRIYIY